jgi:2-polyprenyl-3-methyl-5-hydroxy-6-metoxy-1,4-benzoquinol methylase
MKYSEFFDICRSLSSKIKSQDYDYLLDSNLRYYETFKIISSYIDKGAKVLSIGAGCAYIEAVLASKFDCTVTVVDFPKTIELNFDYYKSLNIKGFGTDITNLNLSDFGNNFDFVICLEVIEHLNFPFTKLLEKVTPTVTNKGKIIVSTPNLGSLWHLRNLFFMRPILADAELTFSQSCYENEGIHRREYMPCEIDASFRKCGYKTVLTKFIMNRKLKTRLDIIQFPFYLVKRLRPTFIMLAEKVASC